MVKSESCEFTYVINQRRFNLRLNLPLLVNSAWPEYFWLRVPSGLHFGQNTRWLGDYCEHAVSEVALPLVYVAF